MTTPTVESPIPAILLIDDDPGTIQVLRKALSEYRDVRFATRGEEGLSLAASLVPDLILLDAEMPGLSGIETLRRIKQIPELADVAVMFVTSHDSPELEIEALELGAVDFLSKPVNANLLRARVRTHLRLKLLTDQLRQAARRDGLTGLANRVELDERLQMEWRRASRTGEPLSVVMIDVDHFKRYNDSVGHLAGDNTLRILAGVLGTHTHRGGDLAARYGGEEFLLILPNTMPKAALELVSRIRQALADIAIGHPDSPVSSSVTISAGLATLLPRPYAQDLTLTLHPPSELIARADEALYQAKHNGRNQAVALPFEPGS